MAKVETNGKITYIGSSQDIKSLIETGALEVSYETADVDLGIQILNGLNKALLGKYDGLVSQVFLQNGP